MFQVDHMRQWQTRFSAVLNSALRWWVNELAELVPQALRQRIANLRGRILLVIDDAGAYLAYEAGERYEPLGRIDLNTDQPGAVQRLLAASPQTGSNIANNIVVRLPAARALRTTVTLPLAAERNLDGVVGFEFERLVPFKREDVYYAHRVLSRDKAAHNLRVELTVVPRSDFRDIARSAQRLDLHVVGLEVAATDPEAAPSPLPLDGDHRPVSRPRAQLAVGGLAGLAVILLLASIVIPFIRAENTLDTLTAEVGEARRKADASLTLQKEIDAEIQDQQSVVARKLQTPSASELLDIITKLTPDDTWLTELQITGGEIYLVGASGSATALLGLVDQSPSFRNAAFRSSITQDLKIGRERFDIAARIAPKEKP